MSDRSVAHPPRLIPWAEYASLHGVTTKTLDRWVRRKILPIPEYINGRKYLPAGVQPQRDNEAA